MIAQKDGSTLPGWRDFERAAALAFGGEAQENKAIFDVLVSISPNSDLRYGVSCKMRRELNRIDRDGRVTIELSNSAGKFWDYLKTQDITQSNYKDKPREVGSALIELVKRWHNAVSTSRGGIVDLKGSFYLTLSWNKAGWYQFHQFPLRLPKASSLSWHFPNTNKAGNPIPGRRLCGVDRYGTLLEWYGESGGQLKYYPLAKNATWSSERFRLESLGDLEHGLLVKVASYFPRHWSETDGHRDTN